MAKWESSLGVFILEFFVEEGCWGNVGGSAHCHVGSDFGTGGGFTLLGSQEGGLVYPRLYCRRIGNLDRDTSCMIRII